MGARQLLAPDKHGCAGRYEAGARCPPASHRSGTNPRTASKDSFAMREFEEFASLRGFDPNLQSRWTRDFPERESLKLASFLLFRAQRAVPRKS